MSMPDLVPSGDVKVICIFPFPDSEDYEAQQYLSKDSKRSELRKALGDRIDSMLVTSIVTDLKPLDELTGRGQLQRPTDSQLKDAVKDLIPLMAKYPDATIMICGKSALQAIYPDKTQLCKMFTSEKGRRVVTNYDPLAVKKNPTLFRNFKRSIATAFMSERIQKLLAGEINTKVFGFKECVTELKKALKLYKEGKIEYILFDLETEGFDPWGGNIVMFSWAHTQADVGFAFPLYVNNKNLSKKFPDSEVPISPLEVSPKEANLVMKLLGQILKIIPIVGHNLKFDAKWLQYHQVIKIEDIKFHADTWIHAFQLYNKRIGDKLNLDTLCYEHFGVRWKSVSQDYLSGIPKLQDRHFGNIPTSLLGPYAAKDSFYNMILFEHFKEFYPDEFLPSTSVVTSAIATFAEIELSGLSVDWTMWNFLNNNYTKVSEEALAEVHKLDLIKTFVDRRVFPRLQEQQKNKRLKKFTYEQLRDEGGGGVSPFSLNSPTQIVELLFGADYFALPKRKGKMFVNRDSGALKTDKHVTKFFAEEFLPPVLEKADELIAAKSLTRIQLAKWTQCLEFLKSYRRWKRIGGKLLPTYINPVPDRSPLDLYRPNYNIVGQVATGRCSSGFHTMDQGSDIPRMYKSRWSNEGGLVLAPDFSQIEVRVVASLAGEWRLLDAYNNGLDIHRQTAAKVYKIDPEEVTGAQRQAGKTFNFFTIYGGGPEALAESLKCTVDEAKEYLATFFKAYPDLHKWVKKSRKDALKNGFVTTAWGRQIPLEIPPEDMKKAEPRKYKMKIAEAERAAGNYPVQSSASDSALWGINHVYRDLKNKNMKSLLIGAVHDSMEADVYPSELFKVMKSFKQICEVDLYEKHDWIKTPLTISMELGTSWGGCIEFDVENLKDDSVSLTGKGFKRDILALKTVAEKAYKVDMEILDKKPISPDRFGPEHFFKDRENWEVKFNFSSI